MADFEKLIMNTWNYCFDLNLWVLDDCVRYYLCSVAENVFIYSPLPVRGVFFSLQQIVVNFQFAEWIYLNTYTNCI